MKVREIIKLTRELYAKMERDPEHKAIYRNEVIELNMRLVPHILKKYKPYTDDMYQEGCIGLIKAADAYDSTKQVPFVNFACLCIEREIQLAHKYSTRRIEYLCDGMNSLDKEGTLDNGDVTNPYDLVPDASAEEAFAKLFSDFGVDNIFFDCIIPCIDIVIEKGKNKSSIDLETWKKLELQYLFELTKEDAQTSRLTFTAMAKNLGTVTQNIRTRHHKLMDSIKVMCEDRGYILG